MRSTADWPPPAGGSDCWAPWASTASAMAQLIRATIRWLNTRPRRSHSPGHFVQIELEDLILAVAARCECEGSPRAPTLRVATPSLPSRKFFATYKMTGRGHGKVDQHRVDAEAGGYGRSSAANALIGVGQLSSVSVLDGKLFPATGHGHSTPVGPVVVVRQALGIMLVEQESAADGCCPGTSARTEPTPRAREYAHSPRRFAARSGRWSTAGRTVLAHPATLPADVRVCMAADGSFKKHPRS